MKLVIAFCLTFLSLTFAYPSMQGDGSDDDEINHLRFRRQALQNSIDLALRHEDRNGIPRRVGRIHGQLDLNGIANNRRNYHVNGGVGAGAVVYRSRNKAHSLGLGVYGSQSRGSYRGFNYRSKPNLGVGVGYKWRF